MSFSGVKTGVYWFNHGWFWDGETWDWQDEGWYLSFFVQPREDFPEKGQPIVDWCESRGIVLREPLPTWEARREFDALVTAEQAFEFRIAWGAECRA